MTTRIGYFIPEYPGQTHIFFWREMQALRELGLQPDVVSTRLPASRLITHAWAQEAMKRTDYLVPLTTRSLLGTLGELLRAGPAGWFRCLRTAARSEGGAGAKLKQLALIVMGAQLAWLARRQSWPHVHVHSCGNSASVGMYAALLAGRPYSITLHGPLADYGPDQKQKWRHARFAIVITKKLLDEVHQELDGCLPPRLELAPMGVDVGRFRRQEPYRPWDGSGPCRLFACGRLNPCKGHDDLIRAVGILQQRGLDAHLHVAGADDSPNGDYRQTLEALVAQLGLAGKVQMLGGQAEERVRAELEEAHVFVLGSLAEPLGVVIMEAMAMEVPVVVTGAGGVAELVEDGRDGLLVPPRQPEKMADALERLLRDPNLARRLSEAGRRKVATSFHNKVSAEVLARCLSV